MTAKAHLARVHDLPCCLCGSGPVEAHHIEGITFGKRKECDWLTLPLCSSCHRGSKGVHGDKSMLRLARKSELELLSETLDAIYG